MRKRAACHYMVRCDRGDVVFRVPSGTLEILKCFRHAAEYLGGAERQANVVCWLRPVFIDEIKLDQILECCLKIFRVVQAAGFRRVRISKRPWNVIGSKKP